jgi:hypothetical protein
MCAFHPLRTSTAPAKVSEMSTEDRLFAAVAARRLVRPAIRAIVLGDQGFLVQRSTQSLKGNYAFIAGEYELGDTSEERLCREFRIRDVADFRIVLLSPNAETQAPRIASAST